jgi:hypothetical protein
VKLASVADSIRLCVPRLGWHGNFCQWPI